MVEKLVPEPFFKKSKFSIYLDQQSEISCCMFLLHTQGNGFLTFLLNDKISMLVAFTSEDIG